MNCRMHSLARLAGILLHQWIEYKLVIRSLGVLFLERVSHLFNGRKLAVDAARLIALNVARLICALF